MSTKKPTKLALDGLNGGDLELHRRRSKFPAKKVNAELATMRGWFLVPGKTGRTLFKLLMFVRVNKRQAVRSATLRASLAAIQSWLNEEPPADATYEQKLSHWKRWSGFAEHAINWANKFTTPRGVDLPFIADVRLFAHRTAERASEELSKLQPTDTDLDGANEQGKLF